MSQKNPSDRDAVISIFGAMRKTGQEDFLGNVRRWHLLLVRDKSGHIVVNIPLWMVIAVFVIFIGFTGMRKRKG